MWINSRRLRAIVVLATLALVLAGLCSGNVCWAQKAPVYAVLIVGNESKPEVRDSEKALITEMTKLLSAKDANSGKLLYPKARSIEVFSYHVNQEREKKYCEKTLNILAEDVLFVGVIELKGRMPSRVIYRLDRIVNEERAAKSVVSHLEDMLTVGLAPTKPEAVKPEATKPQATKPEAAKPDATKPQTTKPEAVKPDATKPQATKPEAVKPEATKPEATAKPETSAPVTTTPAQSTSGSAIEGKPEIRPATPVAQAPVHHSSRVMIAASPNGSDYRCQVGAYGSLENANKCVSKLSGMGYAAKLEKIERGGKTLYRVYVGSFATRHDAEPTLKRLQNDGF